MRWMSLIGALTWAVLLSGCGTLKNVRSFSREYQGPAVGERAQLRVSVREGMVRGVPGRDCLDWDQAGSGVIAITHGGFADPKFTPLPMPAPSMPTQKFRSEGSYAEGEVYIPAGKPMTLHYLSPGYCFLSLTFDAEPNASYETTFSRDEKYCWYHVLKIKEGEGGLTVAEKVKIRPPQCRTQATPNP
ncbi:hypothetical protein [Leeia sp.]|uniref:hypothetical protein n=1 Tax=Leeia sp. TaxID=2884678 RepID=UPI0035B10FD0